MQREPIMQTHVILTDTAGELEPRDFVFEGETAVVMGRASNCQVRLPDPTVSRRHCQLDSDDEAVWVRDLESLNGTFVNGHRLGGKHESGAMARPVRRLHDGDELRLGTRVFRVKLEVVESAESEIDTRPAAGAC